MAAPLSTTSNCFLLIILSTLTISSSSYGNNLKTFSHDTTFPAPVTVPTIVTVPASNPASMTPTNPATTPLPIPSTTPANIPPPTPTNPPAPITVPGGQPITNPVTAYPPPTGNVPVTNPVVSPPATNNTPAVQGQSWCVAKTGASETALQSALDYACGQGGADCSSIQQGGSCYNPSTLQNHASFAFNSYYQKNPSPTSCDFGGTAALVNTNPSTGTCIYPSSSTSSQPSSTTPPATPTTTTPPATPTTTTPPTTPTTIPPPATTTTTSPGPGASGSVTPPSVLNSSSNPPLVFGSDSPPVTNSSTSMSSAWQPFVSCFNLVTSFVIIIILGM